VSKVRIDHGRDGWHWYTGEGDERMVSVTAFPTYYAAKLAAIAAGHTINGAGWKHKLLMWNWHGHALDGYPGWELTRNPGEHADHPAFIKLAHTKGGNQVTSHELASAWDDVAEVDFYQRDWTADGIPFVREGEVYWSGWWFATIAERERFLRWRESRCNPAAPTAAPEEE
jgi:hypothetical protein